MDEIKEPIALDLDAFEQNFTTIKFNGKQWKVGKLKFESYLKFKKYDNDRQKLTKENAKNKINNDSDERIIDNFREQCFLVLKEFNKELIKEDINSISIPGIMKLNIFISNTVKESFLDLGAGAQAQAKIKAALDM